MAKGGLRHWLFGVLAGALAFNLAFLPQTHFRERPPPAPDVPQFLLSPVNRNGTLAGFPPGVPLPHFDGHFWLADGVAVDRLGDYMLDTNLWDAPHTFGQIMRIELPESGSAEDFRQSIEALATEGICRVAVFDALAPVEQQGFATAVQVVSFVDGMGVPRRCYDMVNGGTWTMTQAGPFLRYQQF